MSTVLLTHSKGDQAALKRSLAYFERSVVKGDIDWWVIDTSPEPYNPDPYLCTVFHYPGKWQTFTDIDERIQEKKPDHIIFWGEGDWYHADRIQFHLDHLKGDCHLHGWIDSFLYEVEKRNWLQLGNVNYGSFFETAMTLHMWSVFMQVWKMGVGWNQELLFWSICPPENQILGPNPGLSIGIRTHKDIPYFRWMTDHSNILLRLVGAEDEKELRKSIPRKDLSDS